MRLDIPNQLFISITKKSNKAKEKAVELLKNIQNLKI